MKKIYFLFFLLWCGLQPAQAQETTAPFALLMDLSTNTILLDKNADVPMYPASMTKIMTSYLVYEQLKNGQLAIDDKLLVSEKAWRMGGSKMFVRVGDEVSVEDLIHGIVIQSGNDACIVMAEALAGSEEAFAEAMNEKAGELGMKNTHFKNSTGWPDPEHKTTARDLVILAKSLIETFPEFYQFYGQREFVYHGIRQHNRNPLLGAADGADGVKTGHTEDAGYGLVGAAKRGDRRLVLVIGGLQSDKERAAEARTLMEWGFRGFTNKTLFTEGQQVASVKTWLGDVGTVNLVAPREITLTVPSMLRSNMEMVVRTKAPLPAPIAKGQQIGELSITWPGVKPVIVPLLAGEEVDKVGGVSALMRRTNFYLFGEL